MPDYNLIKSVCEKNARISERVLDNFLIYYAEHKNKTGTEFDSKIKPFKKLTAEFPAGSQARFKSQYIAHKIFEKDGLIHKYLKHALVKNLSRDEKEFLLQQSETPWKFSFSIIKDSPHKDFYLMEDIFRGEDFLLYSPAISDIIRQTKVNIWFNLIGFNSQCWQSYGPIAHYQSFEPDDIYFFSTELEPDIETFGELVLNVEENPVPYTMLISGADLPVIIQGGKKVMFIKSYIDVSSLDVNKMKKDFKIKQKGNVLKLSLNEPGHHDLTYAYYDKDLQEMQLCAMSEEEYELLSDKIKKYHIPVPEFPDLRVSAAMYSIAGEILNQKFTFDEYEHLFIAEPSPEEKENLYNLNKLANLMIPEINAGKKPDYKKLAEKTGLDMDTIRTLHQHINSIVNKK